MAEGKRKAEQRDSDDDWDQDGEDVSMKYSRTSSDGTRTRPRLMQDAAEDPALFHMGHVDGDGEDLEEWEVSEAVLRYASLTDEEVAAAYDRAVNASSMAKYENTLARRGMRASAFGAPCAEMLKGQLLELEESLRVPLKRAGANWESGARGARRERGRGGAAERGSARERERCVSDERTR